MHRLIRTSPRPTVGAVLLVISTCSIASAANGVTPLPKAHAHNDYLHERPLLDALDHGFCSVEADIHLVDGELLVAHDLDKTEPGKTLQKLYLDPLLERTRANQGRVYPEGLGFTLLVDIKSNGEATYAVLRRVLAEYKEMLTEFEGREVRHRGVMVVISGSRAVGAIKADRVRYAAIDGRPSDLDDNPPPQLYPLISQSWRSLFEWRGVGEFSAEERAKLKKLVDRAHDQARRVRFWATPERPDVWKELLAAGVDHINTDRLGQLRDFLLEAEGKRRQVNH